MAKKQRDFIPEVDNRSPEGSPRAGKRLNIKHARQLASLVKSIPDGAQLPDWSHLTTNDRFNIALRTLRAPREGWETMLGHSDRTIDRYIDRGTAIPDEVTMALAVQAELPVRWINTGRTTRRIAPLFYGTAEQFIAPDEDVPLQKLAFKASAGHGMLTIDEAAQYVRFPLVILDHIKVKPQNARLMEAFGRSMEPTISDGDLMVVDISLTTISDGDVYVFSIDEEAFVKRLRRGSKQVIMLSDNRVLFPTDEPVPAHATLNIFGKVKWTGRRL